MAEALLRKHAGDRYEAHSAGLEPAPINSKTYEVLKEIGIDISEQRSKSLLEYYSDADIDYLITVCSGAEAKCPSLPNVGRKLHWPFEDPAAFQGTEEEILAKFREVRDQIEASVKDWVAEMQDKGGK